MSNSNVLLSFLVIIIISCHVCLGQKADVYLRNVNINTTDSIIKTTALYDIKKQQPKYDLDYYWYDAGNIRHNKGGFSGKLLHGKYEVFDNQQKLRVSGFFEFGVMNGNWMRWYPNGNVSVFYSYKNGVLHGELKNYNSNGQPVSVLSYKNGLLHGKSYYFLPDTLITRKYKAGKEIIKAAKADKPEKLSESRKRSEQPKTSVASKQDAQKADAQPKKKWWKLSFLKKKHAETSDKQQGNPSVSKKNNKKETKRARNKEQTQHPDEKQQ